jgi:hypothetical protein
MARDLVQLVFRSTLRNHGGKEPVSLWLIQPPEEVVMHVRESFRDCQHDEISELPFECLSELAAGRTFQGKPTHASKLLKWLADWDGSPGTTRYEAGAMERSSEERGCQGSVQTYRNRWFGQKLQNQAF